MKILHFITSLRTGGAERLVADLLPLLQNYGNEAELLLMDGTRTPLYDEVAAAGVKVSALSQGWRAMRNPFLLHKLVRFLKRGSFDIVHTHNTSCQLLAAAASVSVPVKLVTTEHNTTNRRRGWKWYKPLDRWMYGRYCRIVCVGEEVEKELLASVPSAAGKTCVIPNGINLDRIKNAVPAADISSIPGVKMLMVSAFRAQKDHATLIKAMAGLPETYTLLLAGDAETDSDRTVLQYCRDLADGLGLDSRVRFLGMRSDIPSVLAASDIIVLSTRYEGNPVSAIEAMASGKPFIASDVPGVRELVAGAGVLFPCGDAGKLAEAILSVIPGSTCGACTARAAGFDIARTTSAYSVIYKQI